MNTSLTQFETRLLSAFEAHLNINGNAPTIAELAEALGVSSRGSLHRYLQSLVQKGYLNKKGRGWRNIGLADIMKNTTADNRAASTGSITKEGTAPSATVLSLDAVRQASNHNQTPNLKIPLLGKIAAGMPIEAISNEEHLDLAGFFIGPDRFALRVTGESMIDAGILDGDTVIVKKQSTAKTGDIVVALIDLQEATLKRLGAYDADSIELIPENSSMSILIYSAARVSIQGKLVGQLRTY